MVRFQTWRKSYNKLILWTIRFYRKAIVGTLKKLYNMIIADYLYFLSVIVLLLLISYHMFNGDEAAVLLSSIFIVTASGVLFHIESKKLRYASNKAILQSTAQEVIIEDVIKAWIHINNYHKVIYSSEPDNQYFSSLSKFCEYYFPDQEIMEKIQQFLKINQGGKFLAIFHNHAGEYRCVQIILKHIIADNNKINSSIIIIRDAEESEDLIYGMRSLNFCLYRIDANGSLVDCNPYMRNVFHITGQENFQTLLSEYINLEDINKNWQGILKLSSSFGEKMDFFVIHRAQFNAYGEVHYTKGIAVPLNRVSQEFIANNISNTEYFTILYENFIDYINIPIFIIDENLVVNSVNKKAAEFLGYNGDQRCMDIPIAKIFGDDNIAFYKRAIESIADSGDKHFYYDFIQHEIAAENSQKLVKVRLSKTYGLNGKVFYIIVLEDGGETKSVLHESSHAQRIKTLGYLAGSIAHDFNNILMAITGFCEILMDKIKPENQSYHYISQIKHSADRASNLVNRLLAFSRKQTLQIKVIDLNEAMININVMIKRLVGSDITLKQFTEIDAWNIEVDPIQFEQAIMNLVVNSKQAIEDDETAWIKIDVLNVNLKSIAKLKKDYFNPSGDNHITPGEYVKIIVEDNGCGMSPEQLGKSFDPFFSTKLSKSGTGLGLSTVYGIIKQSGGHIYVKTAEGEGTKFILFFKRSHKKPELYQTLFHNQNFDSEVANLTFNTQKKYSIMLVEDELAVRTVLVNFLNAKGFEVLDFGSASEVQDWLQHHAKEKHIDLVISDVIMPGMNGPVLLKIIEEYYPNIKEIMISGFGEDIFEEEYGSTRDFNFISKPFSLNSMLSKIKAVLEEDETQSSAQPDKDVVE